MSPKFLAPFAGLILLAACSSTQDSQTLSPTVGPTAGGVTLYLDCPLSGQSVSLGEGDYNVDDLVALGIPNDRVSSLSVADGFKVEIFLDKDFSGRSLSFTEDDDCLVNDNFNDLLSSVRVTRTGDSDPGVEDGLKLVWSDEFNGPAGQAVNSADWSFNLGNGDASPPGWGNQELQYYTDSTNNVRMDGQGNLEIVARREPSGPCWNGRNCDFTSGRILTAGKVNFKYGKVEARIKVSGSGAGTWPAFWALGEGTEGWPNIGEIDVMEFVGRAPNEIFGTLHGPGYSGADSISSKVNLGRPVADEFHTYTIIKRPNEIIWELDGNEYHRLTPADVPGNWVFERNFFIILNQAIGGLLPGPVGGNTTFPSTMKVDYVRIYEETGTSNPNPPGPDTDLPTSDRPDFGPNVKIYDDSTPDSVIQGDLDAAFDRMLLSRTAQFGEQRDTFLFKPGTYNVWANMGFYTTLAGLGKNPDDVNITRNINVDSGWNLGDEKNATQNFWRSVENLSVTPENGAMKWAVSQAAPMRRIHVKGDFNMAPSNQDFGQGYSSGGYIADSRIDRGIGSGSQQQWYTRNSSFGAGWDGGVWNMVFSGVQGAPPTAFPNPPHTTLATTPVTREKPYLYLEANGNYSVFVPALQRNSSGVTWPNTPGKSIPLRDFYVARPSDSTATLNQALAEGLNLFFTPGVYELSETLQVTRPDTVVYGLGYPTLVPQNGVNGMEIADVDGVIVAGILFDAGPTNTPVMLTVGETGSSTDHSDNPTIIQDVFVRIGGPLAGKSDISIVVNSDDVVLDHLWLWRGDHGEGIGWNQNTAANGLIVNGDNVLATGLFVEHYQEYQVIWNGENGKTIFFQNEMPYDPPSNAVWKSPTGEGWASYKVSDNVRTHELIGGGAYCVFFSDPNIVASRGFEVPNTPGVRLRTVMTVSLGDVGTILNVVNNTGGPVPNPAGNTVPRNVVSYP